MDRARGKGYVWMSEEWGKAHVWQEEVFGARRYSGRTLAESASDPVVAVARSRPRREACPSAVRTSDVFARERAEEIARRRSAGLLLPFALLNRSTDGWNRRSSDAPPSVAASIRSSASKARRVETTSHPLLRTLADSRPPRRALRGAFAEFFALLSKEFAEEFSSVLRRSSRRCSSRNRPWNSSGNSGSRRRDEVRDKVRDVILEEVFAEVLEEVLRHVLEEVTGGIVEKVVEQVTKEVPAERVKEAGKEVREGRPGGSSGWMVPRGLTLGRSTWEQPEPEQQRFYDSPPPRMDVSVCCLPASAGSGAQHPHPHPPSLPSAGQPTIQPPYQYADQIVPDRGQPDGLPVLGCTGQDNWQQISTASTLAAGLTATTTTYIDYSWLQMQVSLLWTKPPIDAEPTFETATQETYDEAIVRLWK
ncbi:hypothetical protein KM043_010554 [Ampulex compressa]|nr:hypothetical protein KM043_010554 [Ampulex compressa]